MNMVQILAILSLLSAFNVDPSVISDVRSILIQVPAASHVSTEVYAPKIEPVCIPEPVLTLEARPHTGTNQNTEIIGTYSTGCALDENIEWNFKSDKWNRTGNCQDYNYGTFKTYGCPSVSSGFGIQGYKAFYGSVYDLSTTTSFTLSVGDTYKTIVVTPW